MKQFVMAAAVAVCTGSSALAADAAVEEVVVVDTAYDWSGVYVGGQVGSVVDSEWRVTSLLLTPSDFYESDVDGFFGGVHAGYNFQFANKLVLGAETDFNFGSMEGDSYWLESGVADTDWVEEGSLEWFGSSRIRVGYALDRWMPFATAGVAYGKFEAKESYLNGLVTQGETETLVGWTLGGGINYALGANVILGAEYRYTDFGDKDFIQHALVPPFGDGPANVDLSTQDVRFTLAYKF